MFRLFLVNMVKSAQELESVPKSQLPPKRLRNRRIFERFNIDHKHLSLMNDQDILIIRDLSEGGFSTEVGERCFKRLNRGDIYLCRMRYLGEVYECEAQVAWKSKNFVGFKLHQAEDKVRNFFTRLIKPMQIGSSMQEIKEQLTDMQKKKAQLWYQGDFQSNLYIWFENDNTLQAWEFETEEQFIRWDPLNEIKTGRSESNPHALDNPWENSRIDDKIINEDLRKTTIDIFMAIHTPWKEQLITTLSG